MKLQPNKAYYITVTGMIAEVKPADGEGFELDEVQALVEGYIEIVHLNEKQIMIVNEEGKFGKAYNAMATEIARLNEAIISRDYICGNVVVCPSSMLQ